MVLLRAVEACEEVDAGARRRRGAVVRVVRGHPARPLLVGRLARTLVHALLPEARQRRGAARQAEAREQHLDGVLVEDQVQPGHLADLVCNGTSISIRDLFDKGKMRGGSRRLRTRRSA